MRTMARGPKKEPRRRPRGTRDKDQREIVRGARTNPPAAARESEQFAKDREPVGALAQAEIPLRCAGAGEDELI